ncbi:MAG TPA: D-tyrosyl-tRNA(Tyr) deacylase [Gammaproteobacteria bacterium]|nr:D-tyrosyl-tRNA(Tyr) deacylase [Gammaproteobacteria bacterium]
MIGLLQRVSRASVDVEGERVAAIGPGLLVLLGVERGDGQAQAERLLDRLLGYRVFEDEAGRMNRSLLEVGGELLLVPQFTLAADTSHGRRPGFSKAAAPEQGRHWFDVFVRMAQLRHPSTRAGRFGADMQVALVNDGPVTFWLQVSPPEEGHRGAGNNRSVRKFRP